MTAALLREAAQRLREKAEAATPGRWRFTDSEAANDVWAGGMVVVSPDGDPIANVQDDWYENDPDEPAPVNDAEFIALMDPTVALAVADWLDATADENDAPEGSGLAFLNFVSADAFAALAVARAVLRRDS